MGRLEGKVALVIGGSGGIGGHIARGYAAEGAKLGIIGRTKEKVDAAVAALKDTGADALGRTGELSSAASCKSTIEEFAAAFGRLDVLVNSQGTTVLKPIVEVTEEDYDRILATNLKSVFFCCQAAHPHLRAARGSIINIASLSAHRGWTLASPYAASKHGVMALTKSFATEWAPDGIRVNSITPGFFKTALNRAMSPAREAAAVAGTPAGRFGQLEELVGTAIFLASEDARFITGVDIPVDGGFLARGI